MTCAKKWYCTFVAGSQLAVVALRRIGQQYLLEYAMKKVAVFGNAGGGKSMLSRQLAKITGLPLYVLDIIQFREGRYWPEEQSGGKVSDEEYLKTHREILGRDQWIIDGYGSVASAWERFAVADTLVYVDLPLLTHYWVSQRALPLDYSGIQRDGQSIVLCGRARWLATG
jgi:Isopentenyl transferase